MASAHAGLLATSRAFRSLLIDALLEANVQLKERQRGFSEGQFVETMPSYHSSMSSIRQ